LTRERINLLYIHCAHGVCTYRAGVLAFRFAGAVKSVCRPCVAAKIGWVEGRTAPPITAKICGVEGRSAPAIAIAAAGESIRVLFPATGISTININDVSDVHRMHAQHSDAPAPPAAVAGAETAGSASAFLISPDQHHKQHRCTSHAHTQHPYLMLQRQVLLWPAWLVWPQEQLHQFNQQAP